MASTDNSNEITRTSSLTLKKLTLTNYKTKQTYDISLIFKELNIYYGIHTHGIMSGDVSIYEKNDNLISLMPIVGDEYIQVQFGLNSNTKNTEVKDFIHTFFVYALDNLDTSRQSRSYVLHFTSALGIINPDMRISRRYPSVNDDMGGNTKVEDIVLNLKDVIENDKSGFKVYKDIFKSVIQPAQRGNDLIALQDDLINFESIYDFKFTVPNWHPIKMLDYFVSHAVSKNCQSLLTVNNQFCDCLYYENAKGELALTTYYDLFNNQLLNTQNETVTLVQQVKNTTAQERLYNIEKWSLTSLFNTSTQKMSGMMGLEYIVSDYFNNYFDKVDYSNLRIQDTIQKYLKPFASDMVFYPLESLNITNKPMFDYSISGFNVNKDDNQYRDCEIPYRKSIIIKQYLESVTMKVRINAITDLDIGKYVYVKLEENNQDDKTALNKNVQSFVQGTRWVISDIGYHLNNNLKLDVDLTLFTPYLNRGWNETFKSSS